MGKPRMIILIRHAQSEGNKNRDIHQFIPDHRVKLTPDGWGQAEEAGRRLRSMLKPDDTLQFFTSPYRRTRETTEGILRSLTSDDPAPSPFPRHKIKVFEEPRLREQDFGNFQPCSAEMERMWQERADYGHFFYRIPNGESAADAYDRISGFNESMWRLFGEEDFPSVCVLVTHGLMTRVFLMKWYHWSVEYFEDLRNVNHCEFIIMKQSLNNGKYILQNELRTWSELKRRAAAQQSHSASQVSISASTPVKRLPANSSSTKIAPSSPPLPPRHWGGCANGCNHDKINYPRRARRQNTADLSQSPTTKTKDHAFSHGSHATLPAPALRVADAEKDDHPIAAQEADNRHEAIRKTKTPPSGIGTPDIPGGVSVTVQATKVTQTTHASGSRVKEGGSSDADADTSSTSDLEIASNLPHNHHHNQQLPHHHNKLDRANFPRHLHLHPGRDGGGTLSGAATPFDDSDFTANENGEYGEDADDADAESGGGRANSAGYFAPRKPLSLSHSKSVGSKDREKPREKREKREKTEREWVEDSGMGLGARADALGDGMESSEEVEGEADGEVVNVRKLEEEVKNGGDVSELGILDGVVQAQKSRDRKSFSEVY